MRSTVLALVFAIIVAAPSAADDIAETAVTTALEKAKTQAAIRWAFTMTYTDKSEETPRAYKLRYDPRREKGAQWTLLEPALNALSKEEKKALKSIQKGENSDDMLVYDKLNVDFKTATLLNVDDEKATYLVPLVSEDMPKKMREAIRMEVTVNKAGAFLERVRLTADKPFKPAPVAKLETFSQVQDYAPTADGAVLLRFSQSAASGKAVFKSFASKTTTEYSDFERVEVSAPAAASGQ
ncbi:MAG: hypothetical protein AAGJ73_07670 [Pseudomonadota bacterium]